MNKFSLEELAEQALARKTTGETHADLVVQAEGMSKHKRVALEEAALAEGQAGGQYSDTLQWIGEAKEATFTDPFARAAYFRLQIKKISEQELPNPDKVLGTFYSSCGTKMWIRGQLEPQPAIPLFKAVSNKDEARKHGSFLVFPNAYRRKVGTTAKLGMNGVAYWVAATAGDYECLAQMRSIQRKMPSALVHHFAEHTNYDVRDAAWLAMNFMPQARILPDEAVKRMFPGLVQKGSGRKFVRFDISHAEVLLMEKSDHADQVVERFKLFTQAMERVIKR